MNNQLNPFSEASVCPKCEGQDVAAQWCEGEKYVSHKFCERGEHIHRYCRRCGFNWLEATLDNYKHRFADEMTSIARRFAKTK